MNKKIVFVTGRCTEKSIFTTDAPTLQTAIADLYDYNGGEIDKCIFRRIVCKLTECDAIVFYNALATCDAIKQIFTECVDRSDMIAKAMDGVKVE